MYTVRVGRALRKLQPQTRALDHQFRDWNSSGETIVDTDAMTAGKVCRVGYRKRRWTLTEIREVKTHVLKMRQDVTPRRGNARGRRMQKLGIVKSTMQAPYHGKVAHLQHERAHEHCRGGTRRQHCGQRTDRRRDDRVGHRPEEARRRPEYTRVANVRDEVEHDAIAKRHPRAQRKRGESQQHDRERDRCEPDAPSASHGVNRGEAAYQQQPHAEVMKTFPFLFNAGPRQRGQKPRPRTRVDDAEEI